MRLRVELTVEDANRLLGGLILLEIVFVVIYALDTGFGPFRGVNALFDLDGESNVPTWFSSMQLFVAGIVLLSNRGAKAADGAPSTRRLVSLLAVGLIYLSIDEVATIHEGITGTFKGIDWIPRFSGDHGIWVPAYVLVAVAVVVASRRAIAAMWRTYRRESVFIVAGGVLLVSGGLGLEVLSYGLREPGGSLAYSVEVGFEEALEMVGGSVILYGSLLFGLHRQRVLSSSAA